LRRLKPLPGDLNCESQEGLSLKSRKNRIRFKETTLLIFPQTMISKRVENGEEIDVQNMFVGLREKLELIRKENYAGA
jgi:hypothetical protein